MKKVVALFLALSMLLTLCACGRKNSLGAGLAEKYTDKSAKAVEAEELIDAIGTVGRDSGPAIEEAQNFYNSLSRSEKREVENYADLVAAIEAMEKLQYESLKSDKLEAIRKALEAGEYERAFGLVDGAREQLNDDPDLNAVYQEICAAEIASMVATAQSYAANGDYQIALEYLGNCLSKYPNDADLSAVYSAVSFDYQAAVKTAALESARKSAESYDYAAAIRTLEQAQTIVSNDAELDATLSVYRGNYQDSLIQQAEAAYANGGYEAAVSVLNAGLDLLPGNATILSAIAYYEDLAPVYLLDIKPVSEDDGVSERENVKGLTGISYGRGLSGLYFGNDNNWNKYLTNKQYSTLSFRVVLTRADYPDYFKPSITVYGDNDQVLYSLEVTKYDIDPIDVSVDISNQIYVKIVFNTSTYHNTDDYRYIIAMVDARFEK